MSSHPASVDRLLEAHRAEWDDLFWRLGQKLTPAQLAEFLDRANALDPATALGLPSTEGRGFLPKPMSVADLLAVPEPEDVWIARDHVPADANIMSAGYPKSHKTNKTLDLLVTAAAGLKHLHHFSCEKRNRVGAVFMEDRAHRVRRRLDRICQGYGIRLEDLAGYIHLWFRPRRFKLGNAIAMAELRQYVQDLDLDLFWIDAYAYVSEGSSDKDDVVQPQLDALAQLRDARPGLAVGLTHHAKKRQADTGGDMLTDIIRGSGHFGAWYDAAYVMQRTSETSPVSVRSEQRDISSPEPFAFTVEDEFPRDESSGRPASGYLRLAVQDGPASTVQRDAAAVRLVPLVHAFLETSPGCSKNQLRAGVPAQATDVDAAFELMKRKGQARFEAPAKRGMPGRCWLLNGVGLTTSEVGLKPTGVGRSLAIRARPTSPDAVSRGGGSVEGLDTPAELFPDTAEHDAIIAQERGYREIYD